MISESLGNAGLGLRRNLLTARASGQKPGSREAAKIRMFNHWVAGLWSG